MIFEWYSGSDSTQVVPRRLAMLHRDGEDLPYREQVAALEALLEIEEDSNWRGYILTEIGLCLRLEQDVAGAVTHFDAALDAFDPAAGNFDDVLQLYGDALYYLISEEYAGTRSPQRVIECSLALLTLFDKLRLDDFQRAMTLAFLAQALNQLGHLQRSPDFYRAALHCNLRAHHIAPEDPDYLKALVYSYFNLREPRRCKVFFDQFLQVVEAGKQREELERFMIEHFGEIAE